jgi:hypothetical protein
MKKYSIIWIIVWVVVAILVCASGYSNALGGVALAAGISFFLIIKNLSDNWSGTVTEVKKEEYHYTDDNGSHDQIIEYAYIKLQSGKIKKMQNLWRYS